MDITRERSGLDKGEPRPRRTGGRRPDAARSRGITPGGLAVARRRIERPMIQSAFRVHPG